MISILKPTILFLRKLMRYISNYQTKSDHLLDNNNFIHQSQYINWLQSVKNVDSHGNITNLVKIMLDLDDLTCTPPIKCKSDKGCKDKNNSGVNVNALNANNN